MLLHANAVAENRASGVRAGRVNRNDSYRALFLAIVLGQLIDQRTLPCTRGARQPNRARPSAKGEKSLEQVNPSGRVILNR